MTINVLLVEDSTILRNSLGFTLNSQHQIELVGEAQDGRSAMQIMRKIQPDVVVMDIHLPDISGINLTKKLLDRYPDLKILALSIESDSIYVRNMLAAGAKGYLLKQSTPAEVVNAIKAVYQNQFYLSESLHHIALNDYVKQLNGAGSRRSQVLSPREKDVFRLVAIGHAPKEVADILNISTKTAEHHRRKLMEKMDIRTVQGLTVLAIQEGLISENEVLM